MIKGYAALMNKFNKLDNAVKGDILRKSVGNSLKIVQADAKLNCPANHGELRRSIKTKVELNDTSAIGIVYTNKKYAQYVEFGTGPKGQGDHDRISPNVNVAYTQEAWWIPAEEIDEADAVKYHFLKITIKGKDYYRCDGQAAQPFLYPALKNNEENVKKNMHKVFSKKIMEELRK